MNQLITDPKTNHELDNFYRLFTTNKNTLKNLFNHNPSRADILSICDLDCYFDYSKNWIDEKSLDLLCAIADQHNLTNKIDDLFSGKNINTTENRAALHTALRNFESDNIIIKNNNISKAINAIQDKIKLLSDNIQERKLLGFSGKPIDTIVNIGIGGSDLGPKMAYYALRPYWNKKIGCHFVSNIDPANINHVLGSISPETSLFIVSSKSFTTPETLANANTAKNWLLQHSSFEQLKNHFIAITSSIDKALDFGIEKNNILPMWDWVGGRYSLWSAIGIIIALGTSYDTYNSLLAGGNALDKHFKSKAWKENIPVIMALLGIGYINYAHTQSHALLPYCQDLDYFTDYIQQLDMESNGKSVNLNDEIINYKTGPIIWGAPGTNGQHAFHQLLHQGTHVVPCDFIVPVTSNYQPETQQQSLVSNAFAQAKTLMDGYTDTASNYNTLLGNKPSNMLLLPKLTPYYLGILIAMYEHKVFTQGVIWNINSFDQWGVERGKIVANEIFSYLDYNGENRLPLDTSTMNLINKYRELADNV